MAFDNVVDTLTLEEIMPRVVDTVLRSNTFATKMLSKTKRFGAAPWTSLLNIKWARQFNPF